MITTRAPGCGPPHRQHRPLSILRRLVWLLAALLVEHPVAASDFFVCDCGVGADVACQAGNDANAGNSTAAPWRSYDRAQDAWAQFAAGDRVLFCRGGVFTVAGARRWVNANCSAANRCSIGAYTPGSAATARPRLLQSTPGFNGIDLSDPGPANREAGYVLADLELECTGCGENDFGVYLFNDIDDARLQRLRISGFGVGVRLAASDACDAADPSCDARNSRFELLDSEIVGNLAQGFLGSGDAGVIARNRFDGNGRPSVFEHNLYWSGNNVATSAGRILDNQLVRAGGGSAGRCTGSSLVAHGEHLDLQIIGNLISEPLGAAVETCRGIDITAAASPTREAFTNLVIRGNTVRNMGNIAIAVNACVDCLIENNVVIAGQTFAGATTLIRAPGAIRGGEDAALNHLRVRNNSLYARASGGALGIRVDTEGSNHEIVANALRYTGSGVWSCLAVDRTAASYAAIDRQVCGFAGSAGQRWEFANSTLANWQVASGFDVNSIFADPGFAAPDDPSFDLRAANAAAVMVDRGDALFGAPTDFFGNPRPVLPDAGAYEFSLTSASRVFADGFENGSL